MDHTVKSFAVQIGGKKEKLQSKDSQLWVLLGWAEAASVCSKHSALWPQWGQRAPPSWPPAPAPWSEAAVRKGPTESVRKRVEERGKEQRDEENECAYQVKSCDVNSLQNCRKPSSSVVDLSLVKFVIFSCCWYLSVYIIDKTYWPLYCLEQFIGYELISFPPRFEIMEINVPAV